MRVTTIGSRASAVAMLLAAAAVCAVALTSGLVAWCALAVAAGCFAVALVSQLTLTEADASFLHEHGIDGGSLT